VHDRALAGMNDADRDQLLRLLERVRANLSVES
jgi:hypothetical protein